MASPIADLVELTRLFLEVALRDPLSVVLVALGGLLTAAAVGVLGYLALGALVELFTPEVEQPPSRDAR